MERGAWSVERVAAMVENDGAGAEGGAGGRGAGTERGLGCSRPLTACFNLTFH